ARARPPTRGPGSRPRALAPWRRRRTPPGAPRTGFGASPHPRRTRASRPPAAGTSPASRAAGRGDPRWPGGRSAVSGGTPARPLPGPPSAGRAPAHVVEPALEQEVERVHVRVHARLDRVGGPTGPDHPAALE